MTKNIMIVGVGGQGTLLTSRILGGITLDAGYDVKLSEVHGMAQRGGSVVTFVRYGDKVAEPIVEQGQADVLIAFEKLEALRYAHFLKKEHTVYQINAMEEAKKLGNAKVFNIIVLGMAAKHMDFSKEAWLDVIAKTVPPKTVEMNQKAFLASYEA
jgi:indolepyruvate ferredoxin oxidoreductase beta subunit